MAQLRKFVSQSFLISQEFQRLVGIYYLNPCVKSISGKKRKIFDFRCFRLKKKGLMSLEKYRWKHMKLRQLDELAIHYPDLKIMTMSCEINGVHDEYTVLSGSIEASFKGVTYNFATQIALLHGFPQEAPRVRATPGVTVLGRGR